jgi:hypothetical protein
VRVADLGCSDAHYGVQDKLAAAEALLAERAGLGRAAAMGDDWPDLPLLLRAGVRLRAAQCACRGQGAWRTTSPPRAAATARRANSATCCWPAGRYGALLTATCPRWTAAEARAPARAWRRSHLPDLPEVPLPAAAHRPRRRGRQAGHLWWRFGQLLSTYLPLVLMACWRWAPGGWCRTRREAAPVGRASTARARLHDDGFAISVSPPTAACACGCTARGCATTRTPTARDRRRAHPRLAPDGQVTVATAERALANGDGSECSCWAAPRSRQPGPAQG